MFTLKRISRALFEGGYTSCFGIYISVREPGPAMGTFDSLRYGFLKATKVIFGYHMRVPFCKVSGNTAIEVPN